MFALERTFKNSDRQNLIVRTWPLSALAASDEFRTFRALQKVNRPTLAEPDGSCGKPVLRGIHEDQSDQPPFPTRLHPTDRRGSGCTTRIR